MVLPPRLVVLLTLTLSTAIPSTVSSSTTRRSLVAAWTPSPHHRHQGTSSSSSVFSSSPLNGGADRGEARASTRRSTSQRPTLRRYPFNYWASVQSSHARRAGFHRLHGAAPRRGTDNNPGESSSSSSSTSLDPVDDALRWITSDVGSIALGLAGLLALLLAQVLLGAASSSDEFSLDATQAATRSNLLAVFACGAVLVNGVSKLDVQSATAESVVLRGVAVPDPVLDPSYASKSSSWVSQSPWFLQSVLAATPASTAVLIAYDNDSESSSPHWNVVCAAGVLPTANVTELAVPSPTNAPILNRARAAGRGDESYLPTLQALPGRTEFLTYLPSNTQAVLIVPVVNPTAASTESARHLLVLGSNRARSFTPRDILWCQALAVRLGQLVDPKGESG